MKENQTACCIWEKKNTLKVSLELPMKSSLCSKIFPFITQLRSVFSCIYFLPDMHQSFFKISMFVTAVWNSYRVTSFSRPKQYSGQWSDQVSLTAHFWHTVRRWDQHRCIGFQNHLNLLKGLVRDCCKGSQVELHHYGIFLSEWFVG